MIAATYDGWLVLASIFVASFASFTALNMVGRIPDPGAVKGKGWLWGGAAAMGVGIWSMHFIGMLALRLPMQMGYDPLVTLISLLLAVLSSGLALRKVIGRELTWSRLCHSAVLMGAGISGMHYTGMAAMQMRPAPQYSAPLVLLSIVISVVASGAALWLAFHLRHRSSHVVMLRGGAATVMGLATAGMHYTAVAAARFPANAICTMGQQRLSSPWMATFVVGFTCMVLLLALILASLDYRLYSRTAVLAASLEEANDKLRFAALHDPLTALPNRLLLDERLQHELQRSRRSGGCFAVLFMDLDGFKQINDAFGHETGDRLLLQCADRMRGALRAQDMLARVGGDEFVLVAEAENASAAATLAEKLIAVVQRPYQVGGRECQVTVSVGIAMASQGHPDGELLLKNADAAMYHSKALGRNTYCFFDVSMNEDAQTQLQTLGDLRHALERQEFVLHYQPKFDAQSGAMVGAEALIRWNHPVRGMVPPGDFIPIAEKIGLIVPIGAWTIREACRQMREWRSCGAGAWPVAVNLSAMQFNHPKLVETVQESLRFYSLDPSALILEITESTAMRDPDASLAILRRLHEMGVRISIDDFGTGYSSLLYLKRLPATELKIDRGFVRELAENTEDAAIISAIVALGRSLNLDVVAEGVETAEQKHFLTRLGCTSLQGFMLGRPVPPAQLIQDLARGRVESRSSVSSPIRVPKLVAHLPSGY